MKDRPANPGVYLTLLGLVYVNISTYPLDTYNNSWMFCMLSLIMLWECPMGNRLFVITVISVNVMQFSLLKDNGFSLLLA